MNKKLILLSLILCGWIQGISALGLYMINQTGQHLRIRMVSGLRESFKDMTPGETYFFSDAPIHMTVYGPTGGCSNFVGVQMNGSIFNYILIRKQARSPGCYTLGFTGRSRESTPRNIPPVAVEPQSCIGRCWNPTNGCMYPNLGREGSPGYVPQKINRAGSYVQRGQVPGSALRPGTSY